MKENVLEFLKMLEEVTLEREYSKHNCEPSADFKNGVRETINLAKAWFDSNDIKDLPVLLSEKMNS